MKLTKTKLNQLIREALVESWQDDLMKLPDADRDGYGSPSDDDLEYLNTLPPKASKKDFLVSLSKEQKELAEDVLGWWAKQIDETGRLSGHTGKDGSVQRRLWSDEMLTNPPPGAEPVGLYICKLVLEALKGWVHWGDDDRLLPEIKILIEKFNAILAGDDAPEEQPEPEVPEDEKIDPRFANLEFDEALQRYKEGQTMKLTRSKLHQLIGEELNKVKEAHRPIDWRRDAITIPADELKAAGLGHQEQPKDPGGSKAIPVEELTWTGEELKLHSAKGEDHWSTVRTPEALEGWKTIVLSHGPGSTVLLDKHGRWAPASGPWKEKSDAYSAGKAQTLARWGSSH